MKSPHASPIPVADKPLTPQNLLGDFGYRAEMTRQGVRTLFDALRSDGRLALRQWKARFGRRAGQVVDKPAQYLAQLAGRYGVSADAGNATAVLFALQTYYALVVKLLAERFGHGGIDDFLPDNPFSWCDSARLKAVGRLADRLREVLAGYRTAAPTDDGECDLFKPLYQNLFPRSLRRQLGEYYTPDWLAGHVLDQVGYTGEPGQRLLDPACGSGTFLLMALRRMWRGARGEGRGERGEDGQRAGHFSAQSTAVPPSLSSLPSPLSPLVGFDLNPLAVMTARANYLIAVADLLPEHGPVEAPIYLCDSILGDCEELSVGPERFDYVVGNPPWIAWDNLSDEDRRATKPLWERYGLFSLSGSDARHGGGKKDLSMLMLYAAADRYLKPSGRLGMVITQTVFQSKGAGDGFRRFRLGRDGPPLRVLRVDDMVALRPFGDAANWTSTIVLQKGAATEYPVPYFRWGEGRGVRGGGRKTPSDCGPGGEGRGERGEGSFLQQACLARPIDPAKPTSPWLVRSVKTSNNSATIRIGPADYAAHLGVNSGGANGVYWMEMLDQSDHGALIRNVTAKSKRHIDVVEQVIEPDLLHPLLRWGDVRRFSAVPGCHVLLVQDPATRTGIAERVMRERYPRTLAYLERFRDLLASRAAYRRYQGGGPFYSMYNVGPYTIAPIKVVWRRMDRRINAAVVEGRPPVPVPQETCVLVACDSSAEAHYICAALNGAAVNELILAHSVCGGKGFGTPGMLDFIPLERYRPDDPRHVELSLLSRQAHAALLTLPLGDGRGDKVRDDVAPTVELQRRIDELAGELWTG